MPIPRDEMGRTERINLTEDTNHGKIYQFLKKRGPWAYTRGEIYKQLDIPEGSVGPSLTRLKKEDLVEHQGRYWSIHEDEVDERAEYKSKNNKEYNHELQENNGEGDQRDSVDVPYWIKIPEVTVGSDKQKLEDIQ